MSKMDRYLMLAHIIKMQLLDVATQIQPSRNWPKRIRLKAWRTEWFTL
jgi:hypothetical protein